MDVNDIVQMSTDGGDREYSFQVDAQYFSESSQDPVSVIL